MEVLTGRDREYQRSQIVKGDWPHWPILPVKRDSPEVDNPWPTLGLILWREPIARNPVRVYLGNFAERTLSAPKTEAGLTRVSDIVADLPYIEYPDLDGFFDAGWRGD